jgi:hypothetical protein
MFDFCGKSEVSGRPPFRKGSSTVFGSLALAEDEPANAATPRAPAPARRRRREIDLSR